MAWPTPISWAGLEPFREAAGCGKPDQTALPLRKGEMLKSVLLTGIKDATVDDMGEMLETPLGCLRDPYGSSVRQSRLLCPKICRASSLLVSKRKYA